MRGFLALLLTRSAIALDNGLGLTPLLGFNSWVSKAVGCSAERERVRRHTLVKTRACVKSLPMTHDPRVTHRSNPTTFPPTRRIYLRAM
jgi:hypothetical protein